MLKAHKNRWFNCWFSRHIEARLRGTFAGVRISGLAAAQEAVAAGPTLFLANHTAFWDALMIVWLSNRWLHADAYAWMDGHNVARLPFFRWLGAFGVRRGEAMEAGRAMRYAVSLLDRPGRLVWIFPQGKQEPMHLRPYTLQRGSAHLAARAPQATLVATALRYEFGEDEKPWVHVTFQLAPEGAAHSALLEQTLRVQDANIQSPGNEAHVLRFKTSWAWPTHILARLARVLIPRG